MHELSVLAVVPLSMAVVPPARVLQAMLELAVPPAAVPVQLPVTPSRFQKLIELTSRLAVVVPVVAVALAVAIWAQMVVAVVPLAVVVLPLGL